MKLTDEAYNLICEIVERELSNMEKGKEREELLMALQELDQIGTY